MTTRTSRDDLVQLAKDLRLLLLDVDGVMTDGGIILIGDDLEAKRFDVQDGMGINLARAIGLPPIKPGDERAMSGGRPSMLDEPSQVLDSFGLKVSPRMGDPGHYLIERAFVEK
mgnify:CR=1 FL=1